MMIAILVFLATGVIATLAFMPKTLLLLGGAAALGGIAFLWLLAETLIAGKLEPLFSMWALLFPLGYYFLSFPREKTVFTWDRFVVMLAAASILLAPKLKPTRVPSSIRVAGGLWVVFLAVAGISLVNVPASSINGPVRILFEAFAFPAVLGWCVLAGFRVRTEKYIRYLHFAVCIAVIYSAAIGAMEMYLGRDLLPLPGAGLYYAGSDTAFGGVEVLRPNGPFATNHSFSLIGLLSLLLLIFLRSTFKKRPSFAVVALHWVALLASLAEALMPLYRSVMVTIVLIVLLEFIRKKGWTGRMVNIGILLAFALAVMQLLSVAPEQVSQERTSMVNVYGRIAQETQTLGVFANNPTFGVGLANYGYAIARHPSPSSFNGVSALNAPHNTLFEVLAETGILGFAPYLLAQVLLFQAFLRVRDRRTPESALVWRMFFYMFLTYWLTGVSLGSGYAADLNMWYMFAISLLYKFALTEPVPAPLWHRTQVELARMRQSQFRPSAAPVVTR